MKAAAPTALPRPMPRSIAGQYRPSAQLAHNFERAAAQPRLWTPNGVGNGAERTHGYGRGQ